MFDSHWLSAQFSVSTQKVQNYPERVYSFHLKFSHANWDLVLSLISGAFSLLLTGW